MPSVLEVVSVAAVAAMVVGTVEHAAESVVIMGHCSIGHAAVLAHCCHPCWPNGSDPEFSDRCLFCVIHCGIEIQKYFIQM